MWAVFDCFWSELLKTVGPRTALVALGFAQVYFMNDAINYLEQLPAERDVRTAYGLLGAAALIYPLLAVSFDAHWVHRVSIRSTDRCHSPLCHILCW
jgi:hypothetical protein